MHYSQTTHRRRPSCFEIATNRKRLALCTGAKCDQQARRRFSRDVFVRLTPSRATDGTSLAHCKRGPRRISHQATTTRASLQRRRSAVNWSWLSELNPAGEPAEQRLPATTDSLTPASEQSTAAKRAKRKSLGRAKDRPAAATSASSSFCPAAGAGRLLFDAS